MRRLTLQDMTPLATRHGGLCVSSLYLGSGTKLRWRCAQGHEWEATPDNVKAGKWCPICCGRVIPNALEKLHELAALRGGKCLSSVYVNGLVKLRWECSEGHTWEAASCHVKYGAWCPYCGRNAPYTIEDIHTLAARRKGVCLSEVYKNARTPLRWRCEHGHEWKATVNSLTSSKSWCPTCAGQTRLTLDRMRLEAASHGGECLSTAYTNNRGYLTWKCSEGHVWEARADHILGGHWCSYCQDSLGEDLCREWLERRFRVSFPKVWPSWLRCSSKRVHTAFFLCEMRLSMTETSDELTLFSSAVEAGMERVVPDVLTVARPLATPLIAARYEVQRNGKIKEAFLAYRAEPNNLEGLVNAIATELEQKLEAPADQLAQVARYLADEYAQLGDGVLVCSTATGKAFARIRDEDIYQPAPVPRENSDRLVSPLPRLRPDLHGFLIKWVFDEEREKKITIALTARVAQTALQREDGDRRLLPVTREGRKELTQDLKERLPGLLAGVQGKSLEFLRHFEIRETPPENTEGLHALGKRLAVHRIVSPVMDPSTFNLKFDHLTAKGAQLSAYWVRDIASTLAIEAKNLAGTQIDRAWRTPLDMGIAGFWFGHPAFAWCLDGAMAVQGNQGKGAPATCLTGPAGILVIDPTGYECKGREVFDRWETAASISYELFVDFSKVVSVTSHDEPDPEVTAEVVR